MRKIATTVVGVGALAVGAWIAEPAIGVGAQLNVTRTPARTIIGTSDYDGATNELTLRCERQSDEACVFLVDAAGLRRLRVVPGMEARLGSVADFSRSCVLGENETQEHCAWSPVSGSRD